MRFPITFIFVCLLGVIKGQNPLPCPGDSLLEKLTEPSLNGDLFEIPLASGESQYFCDDWLTGSVRLTNGLTVKDQYFRYNGYFDRLIWINKNFKQIRLDKEPIVSFRLDDKDIHGKSYFFEKIKVSDETMPDSLWVFAQLLHRNDLSLYVFRKVIRNGTEMRQKDGIIIDTYQKRNTYYFRTGDRITPGFNKINRNKILSALPGIQPALLQRLRKDSHLRIRTEEELIELTKWLNNRKELWKE